MLPVLSLGGSPSPAERVRQAALSLDDGDTEATLKALTPLVADPDAGLAARFVLAMAAWRLEKFDWALSLLKGCHEDAPENGTIAEILASLHAQLGFLGESLFIGKLSIALESDADLAELVPDDYPPFDRAFLSIKENPLFGRAKDALAAGKLVDAIDKARQHLALVPDDVVGRVFYASCLMRSGAASLAVDALEPIAEQEPSLFARALAACGEQAGATRWHDRAVAAAPKDSGIAAVHVLDAPFIGADAAALARDWIQRFCPPPKPAQRRAVQGKLVIGYLVSSFADPRDGAAVAAVAHAHDRERVTVLGFGLGAQTDEGNTSLAGAFSKWRDIGALDPATLARTLAGDGVHVLVDAGGFAAPRQLQAVARCTSAVRVSWLGNPGAITTPLYDVALGAGVFPVFPRARRSATPNSDVIRFGTDASMGQIDGATVAAWSSVLAAVPNSVLVLRNNDMDPGANIARLVHRFGNELAARIDIRAAVLSEEFYEGIDIALLACRANSPRAASDAIAHGVPAIAPQGSDYAEFLREIGLGAAVATNTNSCGSIAVSLAQSEAARTVAPFGDNAAAIALRIESFVAL